MARYRLSMTLQFNIRNLRSKCGQKDPARKNVRNTFARVRVREFAKIDIVVTETVK